MTFSSLKEFIASEREFKGISLEKLSDATGIPIRFLSNLENGQYEKLPSDVYVRGYLQKIADVLNLDYHQLWEFYRIEKKNLKISGPGDILPVNRFSLRQTQSRFFSFKKMILIFISLLILGYLGWQLSFLFGSPQLYLDAPPVVFQSNIDLAGSISPQDQLTINGNPVYIDKEGRFTYKYQLQVGANNFEFKVKRIFGKEKIFSKVIFYEVPQQ